MRYISLFTYSHRNTTSELRTAIILCKLSVLLLFIAVVLLLLVVIASYVLQSQRAKQLDNGSGHNGTLATITGDNETLSLAGHGNGVKGSLRTVDEHDHYRKPLWFN